MSAVLGARTSKLRLNSTRLGAARLSSARLEATDTNWRDEQTATCRCRRRGVRPRANEHFWPSVSLSLPSSPLLFCAPFLLFASSHRLSGRTKPVAGRAALQGRGRSAPGSAASTGRASGACGRQMQISGQRQLAAPADFSRSSARVVSELGREQITRPCRP